MFQECKGKTEKYADDATHVSAGDSIEEALSHLQKDCEEITKWIEKWRLKSSGPKTEIVIFSSVREEIREPTKKGQGHFVTSHLGDKNFCPFRRQ